MDNRCSISLEARFKLYLKISNKLSKHTLNKLIAKNPKISSHGIAYLTFCSYWPLKSAFSEIFLILDAKALQLKNSIEIDFLAWTTVLHQVIKPHICHFSPQMYFLGSIFLHMKACKLWQNLPKFLHMTIFLHKYNLWYLWQIWALLRTECDISSRDFSVSRLFSIFESTGLGLEKKSW